MLLTDIPDGERVFIDANIFLYDFEGNPLVGAACADFLQRVVRREVEGFTSITVVAEVAHRIMCSEAIRVHGLTPRTVVSALKSQPDLVKALTEHLTVADRIVAMNVVILPVTLNEVLASKSYRQTHGFLSNDSLILAVMDAYSLTAIATHNGDFDRVPTIQTYKPAP